MDEFMASVLASGQHFERLRKAGHKYELNAHCQCEVCREKNARDSYRYYREGLARRILENEQKIRDAELRLVALDELERMEKEQEQRLRELHDEFWRRIRAVEAP